MPAKIPMIPVRKDADEHYRYKMQRLTPRSISSGNGVKTAILNAKTIAKAIYRTPVALCQWFGYALAVQAKPQQQQEQIYLNGDHDSRKLLASLYEFIDTFVLCPVCQNPETVMETRGQGSLRELGLHCRSCGNTSAVQMNKTHYIQKMSSWLMAHIGTETKQTTTVTQQVKGKIDAIDDFQRSEAASIGNDTGSAINVEELTAILKELEPTVEITDKDLDQFFQELVINLHDHEVSNSEVTKHFVDFTDRAAAMIKGATKINYVVQALIEKPDDVLEVIKNRRDFLIRVTPDEAAQKDFVHLMGAAIAKQVPKLMSSLPIIWYTLFDNEIIEESVMKAWLAKPSTRVEKDKKKAAEVRAIVAPFFDWLEKAEFEPEEEEVDEPEVDDNQPEEEDAAEEDEPEEKEEELNIDDI